MPPDRKDKSFLLQKLDWSNPLLQQSVTHRSVAAEHNERLEFLGDAVLSLVVTEWLFNTFSAEDEGLLTRARAYLVRKETLVEVANSLGVGGRLQFEGEENTAGEPIVQDSLLADAVEAIIGAYYLLNGLRSVRAFIKQAFATPLQRIKKIGPSIEQLKDPKSLLQEYMQSHGYSLPVYTVRKQTADNQFTVVCQLEPLAIETMASASSRRQAEQLAAQKALQRIHA